jgi:4-hydroxy 2-oxovalerate aldolase
MTIMKNILCIDSTLRDGAHALRHQVGHDLIQAYARGAEAAGIPILVVGHGNGLGASSLQLGRSLLSDCDMLRIAKKELKRTRLAGFLIPGFGTIKKDIKPAIAAGMQVLIVASHCTEANVTRQHIAYGVKEGLSVYGVLMMSHMASAEELVSQAMLMQEYGVAGVILMDSAGAYLPDDVKEKISVLKKALRIQVGFHAHNNLGLSVANSLVAVESGATIIDATSRGFGAGAGNCPIEVIAAVLEKMGYKTGCDIYKLMDNSEYVIAKYKTTPQEISLVTLSSGLSGVFSGFAPHAVKAAVTFKVDVRDILVELGKRKVVAGQEDIIIEVAHQLKQKKEGRTENFQLESLT